MSCELALENVACCFQPIHDRHPDIHQDQVRLPAFIHIHRLLTIDCFFHAKAHLLEHLAQEGSAVRVILYDQNPIPGLACFQPDYAANRWLCLYFTFRDRLKRELDGERCSFAWFTFYGNCAAHQVNVLLD